MRYLEFHRSLRFMMTLACGGLAAACGSYFAPDRNVRDRLDDSAVLGTWRLTDRSVQLLERDGFRREPPHKDVLTFKSDHNCQFESVLDTDFVPLYVEAPCSWLLAHDTRGDSSERKANALRIRLEVRGVTHERYLNFAREDGRLVLWSYYGDPDLWKFLEYSRVEVSER